MTAIRLASYGFGVLTLVAAAFVLVVLRSPVGLLLVGAALGNLLTHQLLTDDDEEDYNPDAPEIDQK
jgi:hypothetical protein